MSRLLLTGYDDAMQSIGDLTAPLMRDYAHRHGLDFRCIRGFDADTAPSWQKIKHIRQAYRDGYEAVLWLDADTLITDPKRKPPLEFFGLHVSLDWGADACPTDFSLGNFLAGADTDPLWAEAEKRADRFGNGSYWEQGCVREMFHELPWVAEMVYIYARRFWNAVPGQVHPSVVDPWEPGDWLCHLTMLSMPRRVELFHEISREIAGKKKGA